MLFSRLISALSAAFILLGIGPLHSQTISASPAALSYRMVAQGVVPDALTVNVKAPAGVAWSATVAPDPGSDPTWTVLNGSNEPAKGAGPGTIKVELRGWMTG